MRMNKEELRITFYKNKWQYRYIVSGLEKAGCKYGKDMQGYSPKQSHDYLQFYNEKVYKDALKIQEKLEKAMGV